MRGLTLALVVIGLLLSASSAEAKRFRAYVACGVADSTYQPPPSHACPVGDLPHAVFLDRRGVRTRYRLCVTVPAGGRYCANHRTRGRFQRSQRPLGNDALGTHKIEWYARGKLIRRWTLTRTIGD